jgi:ankyrin repeat protein
LRIFGTEEEIVIALQNRFHGLPIHRLVYYQSYNQGVLQDLIAGSGQRRTLRSNLEPTGNQHDCLGMTPLHILACSKTTHMLELYQLIVDKYPANLIVEDAWGATPLLYAIWGDAPSEIVQFLLNSHQSLYPDHHEFNWNAMLITLGKGNAPQRCDYKSS